MKSNNDFFATCYVCKQPIEYGDLYLEMFDEDIMHEECWYEYSNTVKKKYGKSDVAFREEVEEYKED